jgi:hypothetical protein
MEQSRIRELLDLYFEGQTTLMQEQELRCYFASATDLAADLMPYKAMFAAFDSVKEQRPTAVVAKKSRSWVGVVIGSVATVAACLALGLFVWAGDKSEQQIVCYIDGEQITDTEVAVAEAQRMLGSVNEDIMVAMAAIESMNIIQIK